MLFYVRAKEQPRRAPPTFPLTGGELQGTAGTAGSTTAPLHRQLGKHAWKAMHISTNKGFFFSLPELYLLRKQNILN